MFCSHIDVSLSLTLSVKINKQSLIKKKKSLMTADLQNSPNDLDDQEVLLHDSFSKESSPGRGAQERLVGTGKRP